MDVSLLLQDEITVKATVDDATVTIRYLTTADRAAIRRTIATIGEDGTPTIDTSQFDVEVCAACVTGWDGITANGEPLPCTPENVRRVARWSRFSDAVTSVCFSLDSFRSEALEDAKKN